MPFVAKYNDDYIDRCRVEYVEAGRSLADIASGKTISLRQLSRYAAAGEWLKARELYKNSIDNERAILLKTKRELLKHLDNMTAGEITDEENNPLKSLILDLNRINNQLEYLDTSADPERVVYEGGMLIYEWFSGPLGDKSIAKEIKKSLPKIATWAKRRKR